MTGQFYLNTDFRFVQRKLQVTRYCIMFYTTHNFIIITLPIIPPASYKKNDEKYLGIATLHVFISKQIIAFFSQEKQAGNMKKNIFTFATFPI